MLILGYTGLVPAVTFVPSFYCLDKSTVPKLGPEHESRPDTAVNRLDVTTTLIRVKPRVDPPGADPVPQGGGGSTDRVIP